jgi:hypothetical protein
MRNRFEKEKYGSKLWPKCFARCKRIQRFYNHLIHWRRVTLCIVLDSLALTVTTQSHESAVDFNASVVEKGRSIRRVWAWQEHGRDFLEVRTTEGVGSGRNWNGSVDRERGRDRKWNGMELLGKEDRCGRKSWLLIREKAVLNTEGERERESLGKNTLEGKRKRHTFFKYWAVCTVIVMIYLIIKMWNSNFKFRSQFN